MRRNKRNCSLELEWAKQTTGPPLEWKRSVYQFLQVSRDQESSVVGALKYLLCQQDEFLTLLLRKGTFLDEWKANIIRRTDIL